MTRIKYYLCRFLQRLEVDSAIVFGVSSRFWQVFASLITISVIVFHYTPAVQGYYYTFLNLMALQVFAELGLGYVIINFASHEWSRLGLNEQGMIVGEADALARLIGLGRYVFKWYAVAGILTIIGLAALGYAFFLKTSPTDINWVGPWFLLCLFVGIKLYIVPVWALLEGCNQISKVYFYRLVEVIIVNISLWLSIILGANLWAVCISVGTGFFWSIIFLSWKYRRFFSIFLNKASVSVFDMKKEVFQMQWRIAISWMSGYLIFNLFTPLTFRFEGAASAGQMGMTLALVGGPSSVAMLWINSKVPQFGMLIARKEYKELDRLFYRLTIISVLIVSSGALVICLAVYLLYLIASPMSLRILSPLPTGLFLLSAILMQVSFCQSAYLRAHKREPFVSVSVGQGILTGLAIWMLGKQFGAIGMTIGYLMIIALFVIPIGTVIWRRSRIEWH